MKPVQTTDWKLLSNVLEIPDVLKQIPNWVCWKLENIDGRDTKVPYVAGSTRHASSTDASTWMDFETAVGNTSLSATQGIGFVIHGRAVEENLIGFDLDGCRNSETGDLAPWATDLVDSLNSYTEVTHSGMGVRVWVKGKLPEGDRVFNLSPHAGYGEKVKVEVFDHARYPGC